ncbi:MAG: beta-ketoacyl synthase N-terminal-like domain-containing protein, partial [Thermoplasmata archaeon]
MRDVAIIGIGETEFGELWYKSFREIGIEAGLKAIEDAGITSQQIDALYVGNMSAGKFIEQEHVAPLVADYSGLANLHLPSVRVEAAGASGGVALATGYMAVASGMYNTVVVGGAEKMTDVGDTQALQILSATADQEWESVFGATFPSLYAMMARRHMHHEGAACSGRGQEPQERFLEPPCAVQEGDIHGNGAERSSCRQPARDVRLRAFVGWSCGGRSLSLGHSEEVHGHAHQVHRIRHCDGHAGTPQQKGHLHHGCFRDCGKEG